VLTVGCGNSMLPLDLCDDHGYQVSMNIDFNARVVREMAQRDNSTSRPGVSFSTMDIVNLGLRDNCVDIILDKGLIDAMFSDDSEDSRSRCLKVFEEELRVLRPSGTILIVTLCQSHILNLLGHCQPVLASHCELAKVLPMIPKKINSPLRPFCICLKKASTQNLPTFRIQLDFSEETISQTKTVESFKDIITDIEILQTCYAEEYSRKQNKKKKGILLTLDLKPWDSDVNLEQLKQQLLDIQIEEVRWLLEEAEILPVGFGINKVRQKCLIQEDYDMVELTDLLCERLGDFVQSVDIVSNCQANILS